MAIISRKVKRFTKRRTALEIAADARKGHCVNYHDESCTCYLIGKEAVPTYGAKDKIEEEVEG